jgi:tripartite-type tricarboxylate transporter receptor subunit TctC
VSTTASMRSGKLRVLAVSSGQRMEALPEIPTFAEAGVPGLAMNLWWAAMVPSGTPKPVVEQLSKWFNSITASEDAKKFLNGFASDPWVLTPEQAQAELNKEFNDWKRYMEVAKLEPQG